MRDGVPSAHRTIEEESLTWSAQFKRDLVENRIEMKQDKKKKLKA